MELAATTRAIAVPIQAHTAFVALLAVVPTINAFIKTLHAPPTIFVMCPHVCHLQDVV